MINNTQSFDSLDDFFDEFDDAFNTLPQSTQPDIILKNAGLIGDVSKYVNTIKAIDNGRNNDKEIMIHDQALETAVNILNNHMSSHSSQFMVFSGTQAGKTNLMTTYSLLHSDYIATKQNCLLSNKKTVVYIFGPPPKDLQKQTTDRFVKSKLYNSLYNDSSNRLRYVTPANLSTKGECEFSEMLADDRNEGYSIIFFFDEAHEGSGMNTKKDEKAMQKLQSFCKKYSVPLMGQDVPLGRELLEVGIHITATPAHLLYEYEKQEEIKKKNPHHVNKFIITVLKPGKGYYGVLDHDKEDRIYDARDSLIPSLSDLCCEDTNKKLKAKKFFMSLLAEYIKWNIEKKDSGHLIFRYTSSSTKASPKEIFEQWLGEKLKDKIQFKEFSASNGNMDLMNTYISSEPPEGITSIVFVKQGLGRGITLDNKEHIQLCFENRSNDASTLQSFIGRLTGYNLKFHKKLKIYTDCSVIESQRKWLEMFTSATHTLNLQDLNDNMVSLALDPTFIQSSTHLEKTNKETFTADLSKDILCSTREEANNIISKLWPNYLKKGVKLTCSTCSNVNSKDVAEIIRSGLSSARLSGAELVDMNCGYRIIMIHVDGANSNYINSWNSLISEKSNFVGKYLVRYAKYTSVTNIKNNSSDWK